MTRKTGSIYYDNRLENHWKSATTCISQTQGAAASAMKTFEAIVGNHPDATHSDRKILSIMKDIHSKPGDQTRQNELAKRNSLSENQLRYRFQKASQICIRKFKIWIRLLSASRNSIQGSTITKAAMNNGFTDVSHFNKTFKSIFGVNPSIVFKGNYRVFLGEDDIY